MHMHAHAHTHTHTLLYHNHTPFSAGVLPVLGAASNQYGAVPTLWSDEGQVL